MSKITFIPSSLEVEYSVNPPELAKNNVPNWYKEIKSFYRQKPVWNENNEIVNKNIKMCHPFFDAMTYGYIQKTWCDIYIEIQKENVFIRYSDGPEIFQIRNHLNIPNNNDYYPVELAWKQPWIPKTESGHSVLICSPINNYESPFETTAGIIDSDKFYRQPFGNIPFYIKNKYSGLIPKGTPMYQIIPFKRQQYNRKIEKFDEKIFLKGKKIQDKVFWGSYKKNFWQKKEFI